MIPPIRQKKTKRITGIGIALIAAALFAGIWQLYAPAPSIPKTLSVEPAAALPSRVTLDPNTLQAKAAILYNPQTKEVLFGYREEEQLPLASLTKLATALAVLSQGEDRLVFVDEDALAEEGDSGLHEGDAWRLRDLVAFGLTTSSNDAMAAAAISSLSRAGTIERMNAEATNAGLAQSFFLNPTGLDLSSSTAGAYGSARDTALLVEQLLRKYPDVFQATAYDAQPHGASGEGALSTLIPLYSESGFIAGKTGFTDLAGGNLAAVIDVGLGEPLIAVVLGSTPEGRFVDVHTIIDAVRQLRLAQ